MGIYFFFEIRKLRFFQQSVLCLLAFITLFQFSIGCIYIKKCSRVSLLFFVFKLDKVLLKLAIDSDVIIFLTPKIHLKNWWAIKANHQIFWVEMFGKMKKLC